MITRISSVITQFTLLLSAVGGAPASLSVPVSCFWSQPSTFLSPMLVVTLPAGPSTDLNDRPCLVRKSFTRSQSENWLHGPTNRWNLQSAGFAATVIVGFSEEVLRVGVAVLVW